MDHSMVGRTVSHYRILSPLGSGGMGVVYLAEDERLGRQVAVKFLPATWSQERKALERFRVEARAASSLSHPSICAIYDIGQDGDTPYIVMEALKGETLRERIARGPLDVSDVVDVGIQLADALEAAHAQGIVHRDIKPANIFLGDRNRVKVLDFGLAKLTTDSSRSADGGTASAAHTYVNQITQPGTALGTVSYMSPEQARGQDIDARTDLFSLGAVLYEMVTGMQAFGGNTAAVIYDAILNHAPRPIVEVNPRVPQRLDAIIATALEKDRNLRYQHAADLQAELRRVRRDLDSASFVASLSGLPAASRASAPSVPAAGLPHANPAARRWETAAITFVLAAVVVAGYWIWRGQAPESTPAPASVPSPASRTTQPALPPSETSPSRSTGPVSQADPPVASASTPTPPPTPRPEAAAPPPPRRAEPATPPREDPRPGASAAAPTPVPAPAQPAPTAPPPETGKAAVEQTNPPSLPPPAADPAPPPVTPPQIAAPPPTAEPAAPTAVPPAQTTTTPPARGAAAPEPARPAPSPPAVTETDDAAIRRVIRTYETAIETKDLALYRSVRPGLTRTAEAVLQDSFRQVGSQDVDIRIESLRIDGRSATARIARRDTLEIGGRRQTQNSTQTLRFEKTDAGWIIAE